MPRTRAPDRRGGRQLSLRGRGIAVPRALRGRPGHGEGPVGRPVRREPRRCGPRGAVVAGPRRRRLRRWSGRPRPARPVARHYLDHASTTPLRPEAEAGRCESAATGRGGQQGITADPGRVHTEGRIARATFEDARDQVAAFFGVRPRQVSSRRGAPRPSTRPSGEPPGPTGADWCVAGRRALAVRDASARSARWPRSPWTAAGRIDPDAVRRRRRARRSLCRVGPVPRPLPVGQPRGGHGATGARGRRPLRSAGVLVHVDARRRRTRPPRPRGARRRPGLGLAHKLGGPPVSAPWWCAGGSGSSRSWSGATRSGPGGPASRTSPPVVGFGAAVAALADGCRWGTRRPPGGTRADCCEAAPAVAGVT